MELFLLFLLNIRNNIFCPTSIFAEDCQPQEHVINKTLKTGSQKFIHKPLHSTHAHKHAHTHSSFSLFSIIFLFPVAYIKEEWLDSSGFSAEHYKTSSQPDFFSNTILQTQVYENIAVVHVSRSVCKLNITITIAHHI